MTREEFDAKVRKIDGMIVDGNLGEAIAIGKELIELDPMDIELLGALIAAYTGLWALNGFQEDALLVALYSRRLAGIIEKYRPFDAIKLRIHADSAQASAGHSPVSRSRRN